MASISFLLILPNFNPRLREGGDAGDLHGHVTDCISIHASAKEATVEIVRDNSMIVISIHASAKEATGMDYATYAGNAFQSTPPRRRRLHAYVFSDKILQFQSTPPRRRRPQHIVIPQLSCTYLVSTTFLSTFFSFISQYVVLFFLF